MTIIFGGGRQQGKTAARELGRAAAQRKATPADNPYWPEGSKFAAEWEAGRAEAEDEWREVRAQKQAAMHT